VESPQTYKHAIGKVFPWFSDFWFATSHTERTTITLQRKISIPQKIICEHYFCTISHNKRDKEIKEKMFKYNKQYDVIEKIDIFF